MFEPHKNQADVDAVVEQARTVVPDVKVTEYLLTGMRDNIVAAVTVTLPQKGNKKENRRAGSPWVQGER